MDNLHLLHELEKVLRNDSNYCMEDGDLCIFELYGPRLLGSRESQIVFAQSLSNDDDYGCSYTIKKYHSEKDIDDGNWFHTKAELQPLNTVD